MCWFFCIFQMWLVVTLDIYGVGIWSKSYHLVIHYLVNPVRRATTKICTCPDFSMVMWCNFELWMMDISVRLMDSDTHLHWAGVFFFCDHCLLCVYFGMDHEQDWGLPTACLQSHPTRLYTLLSGKIKAVLHVCPGVLGAPHLEVAESVRTIQCRCAFLSNPSALHCIIFRLCPAAFLCSPPVT